MGLKQVSISVFARGKDIDGKLQPVH